MNRPLFLRGALLVACAVVTCNGLVAQIPVVSGSVTVPGATAAATPDATPPQVPPIDSSVSPPPAPSPQISADANGNSSPQRSEPTGLRPDFLGVLGPYRRPHVPELFPGNGARLGSLVKDGKLYLTLHDAIALAIENNLDVEVERDNLVLADTDIRRAQGGGSTRGIDFTVQEPENGVGGPGSPC